MQTMGVKMKLKNKNFLNVLILKLTFNSFDSRSQLRYFTKLFSRSANKRRKNDFIEVFSLEKGLFFFVIIIIVIKYALFIHIPFIENKYKDNSKYLILYYPLHNRFNFEGEIKVLF